ncbi:hypothetical protein BDV19DRAFT_166459 [Aspergillus venezuelensis]
MVSTVFPCLPDPPTPSPSSLRCVCTISYCIIFEPSRSYIVYSLYFLFLVFSSSFPFSFFVITFFSLLGLCITGVAFRHSVCNSAYSMISWLFISVLVGLNCLYSLTTRYQLTE